MVTRISAICCGTGVSTVVTSTVSKLGFGVPSGIHTANASSLTSITWTRPERDALETAKVVGSEELFRASARTCGDALLTESGATARTRETAGAPRRRFALLSERR